MWPPPQLKDAWMEGFMVEAHDTGAILECQLCTVMTSRQVSCHTCKLFVCARCVHDASSGKPYQCVDCAKG